MDYLLDEEIEVQLYEVEEEEFDYEYEMFVNSDPFYESTYQDTDLYEMIEATKKDIYEESLKKNYKKFINAFAKKYDLSIASDSFFPMGDVFLF